MRPVVFNLDPRANAALHCRQRKLRPQRRNQWCRTEPLNGRLGCVRYALNAPVDPAETAKWRVGLDFKADKGRAALAGRVSWEVFADFARRRLGQKV